MKLSNHHIDRSLRDAVKDYSPGIPMPWNEISPLIKKRKRFRFLFFLIPALLVLGAGAFGLYTISGSTNEKEKNSLEAMANEGLGSVIDSKKNRLNAEDAGLPMNHDQADANPGKESKGAQTADARNENAARTDKVKKLSDEDKSSVPEHRKNLTKTDKANILKIYPGPVFPRDAEAPLTNANNKEQLYSTVLSRKMIHGSIRPIALTTNVSGLIVPGRPAVKAFPFKRFYGGLAYRMESMMPQASFDYDPEKIHEDFEKVIREQLPLIKSKTYAFEFGYLLNSNSGIETGLGLAKYQQSFNFTYVYKRAPLYDGTTGKIVGYFELSDTAAKHFNIDNERSLSVLQVPVNIFYRIPLGRRLYAQALTGLQLNLVTGASGKDLDIQQLQLKELSRKDYKSVMSARASGGLFYLLNQYSSIGVEASYYTYLSSIYQTEYYMIRPTIKSMQMSFKLNF